MFAFACCQGYHFTWHCLSHPSTVQPQWISRSSIAAVTHEERHAAHIELLSELKNSTGSGGQQEGCIVGS
jgi:hypothetical protein